MVPFNLHTLFYTIIFIFLCLNTKVLNSEFYLAKSKSLYNNNDFNFDFVVNPEFTKTKAGETVKIKLSLQDINMGEHGLNNVVGYLKYDGSVYESVEIKGINGWEFNQNADNSHSMFGKFVIHKMEESIKNNEDVAELILKLKSDLKPQTTELNFTKLQSSNGDNLVFAVLSLILATIALNIIILKKNKLKSNNSGVKVGIISACGIIVIALTMLCITTFAHSEEITKLINSLDYSICIDFCGFTIYRYTKSGNIFVNNGNLELKDSIDEGDNESGIVSYNDTAIVNNGTLIIGIDDNIVYNTSPRIIGNTTAIDNNGIINFYDGNIQISAEGNVIKGNDINQIPSGYIVNKEDKKYYLLKN